MTKLLELQTRYGHLTVVRRISGQVECACDCGRTRLVKASLLAAGSAISCGCSLGRRVSAYKADKDTDYPEYFIWADIKRRCYNPNFKRFDRYGGRGIYVSDEWRDNFRAFLADVGPRPSPTHTLERIDNDGPYSRYNCEWATRKAQARNRSVVPKYTFRGITATLPELSERFGEDAKNVRQRMNKLGWTFEEAMSGKRS